MIGCTSVSTAPKKSEYDCKKVFDKEMGSNSLMNVFEKIPFWHQRLSEFAVHSPYSIQITKMICLDSILVSVSPL